MKKLKLDLDALEIDTFDPALPEDAGGTVLGNSGWMSCDVWPCMTMNQTCRTCVHLTCNLATCGQFTCGHGTCAYMSCGYATCGQYTCGPTCGDSCFTCGLRTCHWRLC